MEETMSAVAKKNQVSKVQKMAPEEMSILENIGTMIQQMMAGGNPNPIEGEVAMMGDDPEDGVIKAEGDPEEDPDAVAKENNGPTADPSTPAEARVEDPTLNNELNESEVGKAALNMLMNLVSKSAQPKIVQKAAAPTGTNALIMNALSEMTSVMKSISDKQGQTDLAMSNILEGIGFTDEMANQMVQKAAPAAAAHQPVGSPDSAMIMNAFMEVLKNVNGNSVNQTPQTNNFSVKKDQHSELAGSIGALLTRK